MTHVDVSVPDGLPFRADASKILGKPGGCDGPVSDLHNNPALRRLVTKWLRR